jgi:hypothetical protein
MTNFLTHVWYFPYSFIVGNNERHHTSKFLNCGPLIDDYIKYKLRVLIKAITNFEL